jgi:hypothetical protein
MKYDARHRTLHLRRIFVFAALVGASMLSASDAVAAEAIAPYNTTVQTKIQPLVEQLLSRLVTDGRGLKLDGVAVFGGGDKFLPGKIALGFSDLLTDLPKDDPRLPVYLDDFGRIAKQTVGDTNDTWGIYFYLLALNKLREAGELPRAIDPATFAALKVRLDWRRFVNAGDFTLVDLPNNYYGVAFVIARLRAQMGWEDSSGAEKLLAKMLSHYGQYSGIYGFADETDGDGRFDRYSVLLSGEIAQRFLETGSPPPPEVLGWLRKSADVMLLRLNSEGQGFEYGRSLGPYGDTAVVEVLTAAAVAGVLTPREKDLAYAYACRVAQRYASFWVNKATGSVDLWDQGRRADAYRGKDRILGENFSLAHQFFYTSADWNTLGYKDKAPMADFASAIDRLPRRTVTWFARGSYDRMLLTLRDNGRVIGLPLVNGAADQHMHNPYFPIPYAPGMLSGVPDGTAPLLIPSFTLADGSVLEPLAYFQDVKVASDGDKTILTYRLPYMDRIGKREPAADDRLSAAVTYVLSPGRITATATYTPNGAVPIKGVAMEFATYSGAPRQSGALTTFGQGAVTSFGTEGFDACGVHALTDNRDYQTPTGAFANLVDCKRGATTLSAPMTISWTLTYR